MAATEEDGLASYYARKSYGQATTTFDRLGAVTICMSRNLAISLPYFGSGDTRQTTWTDVDVLRVDRASNLRKRLKSLSQRISQSCNSARRA